MVSGNRYGKNERYRRCQNCGLAYSSRGIIPHERNCDRDEPIIDPDEPVLRDDAEGDAASPSPDRDDPPDGESVDPSDDGGVSSETGPTEVVSDGGSRAPPVPDGGSSSKPKSVDELGDRYVPCQDYLDTLREPDVPKEIVDALEDDLSEHDVVDVEETTEESVAAYSLEDVA